MPLASVLVYVPGSLGEVLDERPQSSCSRPMSGALPFALQLFYVPRLWRVGVGVALAEAPRSSGLFRGPQAISTFGSWLAARGGSSG